MVIYGTFFLASCDVPQSSLIIKETPLLLTTATAAKSGIDPEDNEIEEMALIDKIDIIFLESFPLQIHVLVAGRLPDVCTSIQRHEVSNEGETFVIKIFTQRQNDVSCTQNQVPFEVVIPLDVYGLPAGKYLVSAYGVNDEFTFSQDNVPASDGICTLCFPDPTPEDKE